MMHSTLLHSTIARARDHRLAGELERMNERQNDGVERQRVEEVGGGQGET